MYQFQFFVTKHDTTALLLFTSVHHLFSKVKDLGTSIAYCCCIYYPRSLHSLSLANSMAKQVLGRWSLPTMTGRFWMVKIAKSITWKKNIPWTLSRWFTIFRRFNMTDTLWSPGNKNNEKNTHLGNLDPDLHPFFLVLSMVDLLADL